MTDSSPKVSGDELELQRRALLVSTIIDARYGGDRSLRDGTSDEHLLVAIKELVDAARAWEPGS